MATYLELFNLINNNDLTNKIAIAIAVWASGVRAEDPATANHDKRLTIANRVTGDESAWAGRIITAVLADNKGAAVGAITGATDAIIQTNVSATLSAIAEDLKAAGLD